MNRIARLSLLFVSGMGLLAGCAHKSQNQPAQAAPPAYTASATSTAPAPGPQVQGQVLQPGQTLDPLALQWPRFFDTSGYEFALYQPQIDQWPGNQIQGRFATAVRPSGSSNQTYGVVFFTARTEIDKVNRLVTLEDFQITKVDFPAQSTMQKAYSTMLQSELPKAAKTIPLDHLEAVFAVSGNIAKAKIQQVKNEPPRVLYTTRPSLLILVDGAPVFRPLTNTYERVINSRAVLLLNTNALAQSYYLLAASNWYSAPSIEGPWMADPSLPSDINTALDAALATGNVDPMYPKTALAAPLHVYVSTSPAELLQTVGVANMLSIPGTDLLYVSNTDNAILYYIKSGSYYVLMSGRWFKSASLYGPWAFVPSGQLPADFLRIPLDSPKANVLASVAGTPMAREAVIANSIPQTATIEREKAKLTVNYEGAPAFTPIQDTPLQYAANTATPVIQVSPTSYYACEGGVWFASPSPSGPWAVALSVPPVIYTIPVTCPIHYVTYTYVYGSTPSCVYVGYTPGYMGTVVAPDGVVVYGTGYYYPPMIYGATYVCYPPTYGYGWGMAVGAGTGFAFGYCAGAAWGCWAEPHWGCYGWAYPGGYGYAHVNCNSVNYYTHWGTAVHATGSYGYNAYTGTSWAGQHANTFNPYTGGYAAGSHGSYYNAYSGAHGQGSQGVQGNAYTGNYAAGRQGAGYNPSTGTYAAGQKVTTGNAYTGTSSTTDRGVAGNTKTGNAVAWNDGNVYTDHDGNIHHYNTSNDNWDKWSSNGWQSSAKPSTSSWSDRGWDSSSWNNHSDRASSLDRESWGQSLGSSRFESFRGAGGGGWGGSHGGGGFGRR